MNRTVGIARPVSIEPTLAAWREAARPLLKAGIHPHQVDFIDTATASTPSLFPAEQPTTFAFSNPHVPIAFLRRAEFVACHRSPDRWNILYSLLWRLQSNRDLLHIAVDDDVTDLRRLEHQVSRDLHKMHAFVRFRRVEDAQGEAFIAWYQPDHRILPLAAPFFAERFAIMRWSILTPDASMHWDPATKRVEFGPGVDRHMAPEADDLEAMWRTYYGSIYNPARTNLRAMRSEMPVRYWKNLPEIDSVPTLLQQAEERVATMVNQQSKSNAESWVPSEHTLPVLRQAIPDCRGCELYACATQAVFGAGPEQAKLLLVGEQPGDEEDRQGQPFVGPAGRLLDELLAEAGIDRSAAYVTNAVKHFKFVQRGKRRLHENPRLGEITACRPWLLAELDAVQPAIVVCLGASAAKSLLGAKFSLMRERGNFVTSPWAEKVLATLHPSAVLRAPDPQRRAEMRSALLADLKLAQAAIA